MTALVWWAWIGLGLASLSFLALGLVAFFIACIGIEAVLGDEEGL